MKKSIKKKELALDYFIKRLLSSPAKDKIKAIILFGSLAKGEVERDSDIDILIFSKKTQGISQSIWQASIESFAKYRESIEPILYPSEKYRQPDSYFLYQAIRYGKRIYPRGR